MTIGRPANSAAALLIAVGMAVGLPAPVTANSAPPMHFEQLSIEDGLSQSTVLAITQDSTGFLWFGTENGLNRFDGYDFIHYRRSHDDPGSLQIDFVSSLAAAQNGDVWLATDGGGIARWDNATGRFRMYDHGSGAGLAEDHIRVLAIGPAGYIWVGTRGSGLDRFDPTNGEVVHFRASGAPDSLAHDDIYDLDFDNRGQLWIATGNGVSRLDTASGSIVNFAVGEPDVDNVTESVLVDSAGIVWVGTQHDGLVRIDPGSGEQRHFRHDPDDAESLSHARVQVLFEDREQRFWVGTADGLNLMNRRAGTFTRYRHKDGDDTSIGDSNVLSLFQDRSGVLWVGTRNGGISKWIPSSWSLGHVAPRSSYGGLTHGLISSFTEDRQGKLYVGTVGGGINVFDANLTVTEVWRAGPSADEGLSDDRIMALLTDSRDRVWAGTMGGGLNRIDTDDSSITRYRHDSDDESSLPANGVMSLLEDRSGNVWVGTYGGGVARLGVESGTFSRYGPDEASAVQIPASRATTLLQAADGVIWIGTDGDGLVALDPVTGTFEQFVHDRGDVSSLSSDAVYSLHLSSRGEIWIGTRSGLNRLVRGENGRTRGFDVLTRRDGLSNETIYGIREDSQGRLWLSTNYGLTRYDPATATARQFHRGNGLQGEEFNFGAHFADRAGRLYFGGANGFNAFDPDRLPVNAVPPPVALTGISKLNVAVDVDRPYHRLGEIALDYEDAVVTFEFAALDFVAPQQNRYAYRLDGFDRDWIDAGTQRRVTYTNLDQGDYVLRVRAANSDGIWSEQPVALSLQVAPAPWATWWAWGIYVTALVAILAWFVRQQRRKVEREARYRRRLEDEVQLRTQEIAESNSALRTANEKLHEASHTDALTGLRNRRYLFQELLQEVENSGRFRIRGDADSAASELALLMVDLDHFKPVNDTLGHQAGDQMLLQVRDALLEASRPTDDVIRWGGDEFLVVARRTDRNEAMALAERIRVRISERLFALGYGKTARTTCSIGIATYPFVPNRPALLDWEQVLAIADISMYRAKARRDAWYCVSGEQWSGTGDALMAAIKDNLDELAGDGAVRIDHVGSERHEEIA